MFQIDLKSRDSRSLVESRGLSLPWRRRGDLLYARFVGYYLKKRDASQEHTPARTQGTPRRRRGDFLYARFWALLLKEGEDAR